MKILAILALVLMSFCSLAETATSSVSSFNGVETLKLIKKYQGEEKTRFYKATKYFSEEERKMFALRFNKRGLLVNADGTKFDTNGLKNDMARFVIDSEGNIYSAYSDTIGVQHSSFVGGKDVVCAGYWDVGGGDIQLINDRSTHYISSDHKNLDSCIDYLKSRGMNFNDVAVIYSSDI